MKTIKISNDGTLQMIFSDDLLGVLGLGNSEIKRASHVEPTSDCKWTADMSPVGGPLLGPFSTRAMALKAETDWINQNIIGVV